MSEITSIANIHTIFVCTYKGVHWQGTIFQTKIRLKKVALNTVIFGR